MPANVLQRVRTLLTGRGSFDEIVPPRERLPGYARRRFKQTGRRFLATAIQAGLEPQHRVLDLGCGPGRFAVAMSGYLEERGRYVGVDVDQQMVRTCNEWIASRRPHFTFVWADVFNTQYNSEADARAAHYRLPFEDQAFDFVFSNSLFTHLLPDDAHNYITEIGRVLKPKGRTLNTIFLLNEDSVERLETGKTRHGVLHELNSVARVKDPERPEAWIALTEGFIRAAHAQAGLHIEGVRYGAWAGGESSGPGFGDKDIIVAVRDPG